MLKSPFPYFGGKSIIAPEVWRRMGADIRNYIEPFAGSAAMLLARPGWTPNDNYIETINDADGFVSNFWRAVQADPDGVAHHADNPVNENDLHARHAWLVQSHLEPLPPLLEGDPDYFDAKIAGWWAWGMCCWIGGGFCSGNGPWRQVDMEDGPRQLVRLGSAGMGVKRQRVHLGDAGRGVNRKRVHLGNAGKGVNRPQSNLVQWMRDLQQRLRRVRVCCGDWARICGPTQAKLGQVGVFLDPPYSTKAGRDMALYATDSGTVAHDVREWAIDRGHDPQFRIALCGYEGEHAMPDGWTALRWSTNGGYERRGSGPYQGNRHRETIWFSPHCIKPEETHDQLHLFDTEDNRP